MPDGVADKLEKEFAKYKPHEPEGGPKQAIDSLAVNEHFIH